MVFSSRAQAVWRGMVVTVIATDTAMGDAFNGLGRDCLSWIKRIARSGQHVSTTRCVARESGVGVGRVQ